MDGWRKGNDGGMTDEIRESKKGTFTKTGRCTQASTLLIQLGKDGDKSPHACSAAGTNLNTVYMLRRVREI